MKLTSACLLALFASISWSCARSQPPAAASRQPISSAIPADATSSPGNSSKTPASPPLAGRAAIDAALNATDYSEERYRLVEKKDEIVSVLKNGLTVCVRRIATPVVSVQAFVHTGSVYEGKWLGGGLSHLLEHLVAGGSCQRRTEAQNLDLLQSIGDNSDAYTDYDHTVFFVDTTPDHIDQAADLVTGWVFGASITPAEYHREYQVVQRELERDLGEPDWVFYEMTMNNRYLYSPRRIPVVGYQAVIQGLSRDDVYSYYQSAYVPENMVFGVAGNLDPEVMLAAVRKYVRDVKPGRMPSKAIVGEPPVQAPRTLAATFPRLGQAKLEVAFPSVRQTDPDMYPLDLLATILGGGESSILVENLRDRQHLVSNISAGDDTPFFVEGTFAVDMDLSSDKIKPATDAVLEEIEKCKMQLLPEERIQRAKHMLRASIAMNLQTAENQAGAIVQNYLATGTPDDTYADRIDKVTAEQIRDAARKYLDRSKLLTTALLPAEEMNGQGATTGTATSAATASSTTRPATPLANAADLLRQAVPTTQNAAEAASTPARRIVLDNGTVLIVKRVVSSPVVSIQMLSLGGLTAEDAKTNGLSNLTMQLIPRGTRTPARSADELAAFFDSLGASFHATCGNNSWGWSASCLKGDFDKVFEIFGDMVTSPSFPNDEIGPMKHRIDAAIDEQDSNWRDLSYRYFREQFYGPLNSPYQFTALGTKKNVDSFTPEQIRQWYQEHVLTAPRVISVYGDIDPDAVEKLAQKSFGHLPRPQSEISALHPGQPPVEITSEKGPATLDVVRVQVQKTDNPEAAVYVGFESDESVGDDETSPLVMAQTLCSGYGYPTGYIFETLRGEGLVYEAAAVNFFGRDKKLPGSFWAYGGCDPKNVDRVADGILLNIARLQGSEADLDAKWFDRAQNLVIAINAMEDETCEAQALESGIDELLGLGYNYHAGFGKRIKAVTLPQVQSVARRRLRKCIVTISTDHPEWVKTAPGVRSYSSFPKVDLTPQGIQHDVGGKS